MAMVHATAFVHGGGTTHVAVAQGSGWRGGVEHHFAAHHHLRVGQADWTANAAIRKQVTMRDGHFPWAIEVCDHLACRSGWQPVRCAFGSRDGLATEDRCAKRAGIRARHDVARVEAEAQQAGIDPVLRSGRWSP